MNTNSDHRGTPVGSNHPNERFSDRLRRRNRADDMAKVTGGKVVYGSVNEFSNSDNRPIYSLPDSDPSTAGEITTRFRKYAPTLHDPDTGEYAMLRTPTFTVGGANRKAARSAEQYVKEGYVK